MTPEAFRDALARSGITPEKPLYPVLLTVWEAAETTRTAATDGARGLTAEGERALIDKVGGGDVFTNPERIKLRIGCKFFRTGYVGAFAHVYKIRFGSYD